MNSLELTGLSGHRAGQLKNYARGHHSAFDRTTAPVAFGRQAGETFNLCLTRLLIHIIITVS